MNFRTTLKRVYFPTLLGIILLSVSLRIAALFSNYNSDTGFFEGKILINTASVLVTAGSVFLFTYAFSAKKDRKLIADFSTPATYVPTGTLTVAMMFFAAMTYISSKKTGFSILKFMSIPGTTTKDLLSYISLNMSAMLLSVMAPMACLAVGYFIMTACVLRRSSSLRAFFGTANVLFLAFYTSYLYFDTETLARNAPNKIVDQMAFLFAALFFLYEIRISLGREKWNLYMAFGFIAATLTAYSSIPSLVFYFADGSVISNNIQENVLSFAIFVFILSRIILAAFLKEDRESESIFAVRDFARSRTEYITEKEKAAKRAYMELYAELNSIDNVSDEDDGDEAIQMTFDESIDAATLGSEYAEAEFVLPSDEFSENPEQSQQSSAVPEFVQESILFPTEEPDYEETAEISDSDELSPNNPPNNERNIQ